MVKDEISGKTLRYHFNDDGNQVSVDDELGYAMYTRYDRTDDNVMMFKQIVRAVAMRSGIHASFLPKPLADQAGSGLHINLSLYMDGKNLFEGDIAPDSIAGSFMAGVLAHSRALTVFTNPLPNSYLRFGSDDIILNYFKFNNILNLCWNKIWLLK